MKPPRSAQKVYWRPDYSKLSFFDEQTENNIGYPQEDISLLPIQAGIHVMLF